jgi:hypothetical protein
MLAAMAISSQAPVVANGAQEPPFSVSKETTAITGPLHDDGSVDYVAALNQRHGQGITPENNGFVLCANRNWNPAEKKSHAEALRREENLASFAPLRETSFISRHILR